MEIQDKLNGRIDKQEFIIYLKNNPTQFNNAIKIALGNDPILAWRAAWVIGHSIDKNDKRIQPIVKKFVEAIDSKKDGHQRELLKIIEKMKVPEDIEGSLFDVCISIWEEIHKSSSVRITAFRVLLNITKKYPELSNEIQFLTQDRYIETLSDGIKHSFYKLTKSGRNSILYNKRKKWI